MKAERREHWKSEPRFDFKEKIPGILGVLHYDKLQGLNPLLPAPLRRACRH